MRDRQFRFWSLADALLLLLQDPAPHCHTADSLNDLRRALLILGSDEVVCYLQLLDFVVGIVCLCAHAIGRVELQISAADIACDCYGVENVAVLHAVEYPAKPDESIVDVVVIVRI